MFPRPKCALLLLAAVLFFSGIYIVRIRTEMADFEVGYRAGQRLTAGDSLYQTGDGHYMFKYFPFSAVVYVPFSRLPLETAKPLWYALSIAAAGLLLYLARALVPGPAIATQYLALLPPLILAKFFFHELNLGQINILVTLMMMLGVRALNRSSSVRSQLLAGTLAGIATALKPYALLFFPYFAVKRLGWSLLAGFGFLLLALFLPSVFYGFRGNLDVLGQWATTLSASTPALLASNDNVSIVAFFLKWTGNPRVAMALGGLALAALGIVMVGVIARGGGTANTVVLEGALLLVLIPLVSPLGWDYTLLMSLLAITLLVNAFFRFPALARVGLVANFAVVALALSDLMGREAYSAFMQWSVTTVNFVVVILSLAYLRFTRVY